MPGELERICGWIDLSVEEAIQVVGSELLGLYE